MKYSNVQKKKNNQIIDILTSNKFGYPVVHILIEFLLILVGIFVSCENCIDKWHMNLLLVTG